MNLLTGADPIASWWIAVAFLFVVTGVVAVLLRAIVRTAKAIDGEVAEIWVRGQRVANNTIHIASLYKTADLVDRILGRAERIASHAAAIKDHAEDCPGCPSCIWRNS
ncbi:MAG: hypothetical protein ACTS3R_21365 [Inquilinaceae bacterium]